jgi:hypothetical protein
MLMLMLQYNITVYKTVFVKKNPRFRNTYKTPFIKKNLWKVHFVAVYCIIITCHAVALSVEALRYRKARGGAVGWGTALQKGTRWRCRLRHCATESHTVAQLVEALRYKSVDCATIAVKLLAWRSQLTTRPQCTKCRLCSASWWWASNARNM